MKKILLWLCLVLPFLGIAQETAPVAFRLDTKQLNVPNPDQMQVFIQTSVNGWTDIPMEDVGGNGIWRKVINISHPTDENVDVFYRFKITSFSNSGLPYTAWEGGTNADLEDCTIPPSEFGLAGGLIRDVVVPQELIDNGTYVNPTGEYKLTHCFNICGNAPCPPEPCVDGLTSTNAYQQCLAGGQALIVFEWETECEVQSVEYSNVDGAGPFTYQVASDAVNFGVYAGYGQMPPNWSVEHQLIVNFVDGTQSDPILYTPESCIEGCTDPNSESYNPWATVDDGSCSGTTCDTEVTDQITVEITFDNWPSETGWSLTSGIYGVIGEEQAGAYDYNDIGQTYTYNFCVDKNAGFEFIITDTYGDGLAGSTSGGTLDGSVIIYDCNGEVIWELNPDFGEVAYSGQQFGVECEGIEEIYGCTDPAYQSYNPEATIDDGSCTDLHIIGCTDENSINYNPDATKQELIPVCDYTLIIKDAAGDGWGNSYLGVSQGGVPLGTYTMGPGEYEQTFPLQLSSAEEIKVYYFQVGGPQSTPQEVQFQTWHNSFIIEGADGEILISEGENPFENNGQGALQNFESPFFITYTALPFCGTVCIPIVEGCMTEGSLNYNPEANVDDGSCIPYIEGCMNPLAFNYNPDATVDDGSCVPVVVGCMDPDSFNYDPEANTPGDCIPVVLGCTDPASFNYNENANTDDGSCVPIIEGCTDPNSINYNSQANTDDGSCVPIVLGCTDPSSFNFNPEANTDDGSCVPIIYGCMDPDAFNYNPDANVDNGSCEPVVYGCTDPNSFNYDPEANTDNGSCQEFVYGCMDPNSFNYNPDANVNQVSATDFTNPCIPIVYGCTDPTSVNYDPEANVDNGSCITAIVGCTDPNSYNYNPEANVPDPEACLYDAGCITGPGEPYWLNDQCYAWVIDVDNYCCDNEWDPVCQEMYNYCENGWPDGFDINGMFNRSFNSIVVYPNPTNNMLNIGTTLEVTYSLTDLNGRTIINNSSEKTVDMSDLESGVYFLTINHDGQVFNKRIIKQ